MYEKINKRETKKVTLIKVYYMALPDMRGRVEEAFPMLASYSLDKLKDYYEKERVDWKDEELTEDNYGRSHTYKKSFRKGSKLEWCNQMDERINCPLDQLLFGGYSHWWLDEEKIKKLEVELI